MGSAKPWSPLQGFAFATRDSITCMVKRVTPNALCGVSLLCLMLFFAPIRAQTVAATPPLGWNSWDSYGLSVTKNEWKSNVVWFHQHL